ncbi:MAG: YidC/Oxa1 family membrane protein insertase, partial [Acidimicrobiales bacterium]
MIPHLTMVVAKAATTCPLPTKTTGHSIFAAIARPIADVLAFFYSLVPNYAFAILCLSVVWMLIIAPLTLKSTRSMLAMQRLQTPMKKLQAEHKNDRQALNQAMMDLYKQEGVSPLGGCLPMLLPLPVFFALFQVIDGLSYIHLVNGVRCPDPHYLSPHTAMFKAIFRANGHINAVGLDLAKNALSAHSSFLAALPYFAVLLIMIGTQYLQNAQMMARNPSAQDNPQMRYMKYLPIVFGIIFIRFPAGVILYYAASSVCRIIQQTLMYRFDPQVKRLAAKDIREVETEVEEIEHGRRRPQGPQPSTASSQKPTPSRPGGRFREALARQQQAVAERQRAQADTRSGRVGKAPVPSGAGAAKSGRPGGGRGDRPPSDGRPAQTGNAGGGATPKA